jgi:hypothetical protein
MKLIRGLAMLLALAAAGCEPAPTEGQGPEPGRYPGDGVTAIQQAATQSYATPYLNMSTYPFTVEPVNVAVGWISGNNWVLYQRKSDQHCTFYQVSSTSQVSGVQLIVSASRGADTVYVPTTGQNYWFYCANYGASWEVDPLNVAPSTGVTVSVNAGNGNNTIYCGGATQDSAAYGTFGYYGGDDPDLFHCYGYYVTVQSGGSGDIIYQHTSSSHNASYGQDGNDCLFGNGGLTDCGAGTGDMSQPNTSGTFNCETSISSCL